MTLREWQATAGLFVRPTVFNRKNYYYTGDRVTAGAPCSVPLKYYYHCVGTTTEPVTAAVVVCVVDIIEWRLFFNQQRRIIVANFIRTAIDTIICTFELVMIYYR